ncbi:helix-turn-helix domain-containing protein [Bradyrhizobium sp. CB82]|uniref:helix-turn-helix domain-containing protein n=1 Tax=Bradyrhizobium sp. CB82 TaxID=3039159 RepID=UPI0024B0F7A1|nr:helix-turn-helix domain-containing protein [Bradyrhizobium sp. CB82]WFU39078.1 helix-turn-helix domain-containing protein [Bradyrhizobium sp. CB82]
MTTVTVRRTEFFDFEALRDAVQDGSLEVVQLEHGKISGTLTHISVGSLGISTGSFSRGVRFRGALSEQRWQIGMTLSAPALIEHVETTPGDHIITAPHQEFYSSHHSGNQYAAAFITPSELFAFLDAQQPGAADAWRRANSVLKTDPAAAAINVAQFRMVLAALNTHGPALPDEVVEFYKRRILELLTAPIRTTGYRGPHPKSAAKLVRAVDRYLVDAGNRPVHISELCERFEVPRRSLHRAFDDVLGIPPITFLRRKRLGDVHTALLRAGPGVTISGISIKHGFGDDGRFAKEYRLLFGELPHETLRRRNVIVNRN